jgi:hypothetical protein
LGVAGLGHVVGFVAAFRVEQLMPSPASGTAQDRNFRHGRQQFLERVHDVSPAMVNGCLPILRGHRTGSVVSGIQWRC